MKKSKFWTIIFSLFPGVGHMYLGLMQRGLQFCLIATALIVISIITQLGVLGALGPVIWFYSLFDAMQRADLIRQEQTVPDELLFPWNKIPVSSRWGGWLLIIFGFIILVNNTFNLRELLPDLPVLDFIFSINYSVLILSLFMIIFGVIIIRRNARTQDI
ncbi:MAG TPA: hypothetical protein VHY08_13920 [Bacillota bacterium]|nr:hypothetical protein [Bacillota bacterium]